MKIIKMWEDTPAVSGEEPVLKYYPAKEKKTRAAVVIFPGGAYKYRAAHEGEGYALFLNSIGMDAFVCEYRVAPYVFPIPLLDARRAIRYIRAHADVFDISPEKIAVMGSSAGGHLAALVSTYKAPISFESIDQVDEYPFLPNATILCYPVCHYPDGTYIQSSGSFGNLMGKGRESDYPSVSPDLLVDEDTPPAFLWHTAEDNTSVVSSYLYAMSLRKYNIPHELHVFPYGHHGLGLASQHPHVGKWTALLQSWFVEMGWI